MKALLSILTSTLLLTGCGAHYYRPSVTPDERPELTVSAYTQQGCLDTLEEEAVARHVTVALRDVRANLGWEIVLWPLYKGYQCTGVVTGSR
ncbi:MAG: hypothetical protein KGK17_00125 [Betaproteobacteria bacterium]|nr:hypothetical protein [Betaproteobacteria bacterium]